jgi:tetratricopeptide (TPR) repeat protein
MKKIIAIGLITVSCVFSLVAQEADPKNEKQQLTDTIFALYQKGDFEEAIKLGEKLVKMETTAKDSVSYVNAAVNLARIKRAYFTALQEELRGGRRTVSERQALVEKANRHADDAEELFREALEINTKNGREKTAQTADIKRDLAWIVSNHSYTRRTDRVDRTRLRIDEAEALLLDAVALSEQARKADADETLFIALDAGDFYYKYVNFEKALPFYERFINVYGQKHGANHPALLGALRPFAAIMFATFQDAEASAAIKRIEAITKKSEPALTGEINLYLRSKDAVAAAMPVMKEQNERAQTYRNIRGTSQTGSYSRQLLGIITVPVAVEIDEQGKVVKASAKTTDEKLKAEAEAAVAKWTVRPFSYNGTSRKMRGTLVYRKVR